MLGLQSFDNAGWRDKKAGNWCFLVLSLCLLPCVPAELGPEGVAAPVAFGITDLDDLLTCFFFTGLGAVLGMGGVGSTSLSGEAGENVLSFPLTTLDISIVWVMVWLGVIWLRLMPSLWEGPLPGLWSFALAESMYFCLVISLLTLLRQCMSWLARPGICDFPEAFPLVFLFRLALGWFGPAVVVMSGIATSSHTATLPFTALLLLVSVRSVMEMFWGWDVSFSRVSCSVSWVLGRAGPSAGEGMSSLVLRCHRWPNWSNLWCLGH